MSIIFVLNFILRNYLHEKQKQKQKNKNKTKQNKYQNQNLNKIYMLTDERKDAKKGSAFTVNKVEAMEAVRNMHEYYKESENFTVKKQLITSITKRDNSENTTLETPPKASVFRQYIELLQRQCKNKYIFLYFVFIYYCLLLHPIQLLD